MIKIVWDWNGTLLDDVDLCLQCINRLLKKEELPALDLAGYREVFTFPIKDYYIKAGFDFDKTPWPVLAQDYMDDYMPKSLSCPLSAGAMETLEEARKAGFDNVLISASQLDNLLVQLAQYPLASVLSAVYGIGDIYAHSKLELALRFKETCLPEDRIFCIGDSLHDAQIAAQIGAECILVTTGHQSKKRLETAGVPVVEGPHQALEVIYDRTHRQCK